MLIIRGVNVFPSQIEELILRERVFAPVYLLEVDRQGSLDSLTVHVERPQDALTSTQARDTAARQLAHHIKSSVGISAVVKVTEPMSLERSAGKARRVLDRRRG